MTSVLKQALKFGDALIPCFPCRSDKRPFPGSHGFKDATSSPDDLRALWQRFPGELIAVPTGEPSGLFVIDIDSDRHTEANDWFERHSPYLPDTRQHQTQSGGWHLLFQHRAGLRNTASKLAKGVDTRGNGGYIVWWPAHIESACHRLNPIEPLPDWIVEALNPPSRPMRDSSAVTSGTVARARRTALAPDRLQGIIATVASAREGERNHLTFWGACRINEMLAEGELDQNSGADALAALADVAQRRGLQHLEIKRTIESAFR